MGPPEKSAAEAAELAENLPNGTAIGVAVIAKEKETHFADLLIRFCLASTVKIVTEM